MPRPLFVPAWAAAALALLAAPAAAAPVRVAGADVGSTGVRAVVIEYDPDTPDAPPRVLMRRETNPAAGVLKDGQLLPARVAETAEDLARFVDLFVKEYRVAPDRIRLVGSSSLAAVPNRDSLAKAVEEKTGQRMTFLGSPEEEAGLTADGLAVLAGGEVGLLIDVGGGNAKGGVSTGTGYDAFGIPFGSRSLTNAARDVEKAKKVSFREAVAAVRDADLVPAARKEFAGKPTLVGRTPVTLTGGIAYATAALVHPGRATAPTVTLTLADFRKLIELLGPDAPAFPAVDLLSIADPAVRKQAGEDVRKVGDIFPPENLFSGATVVLAIGTELRLEGKPLTFVRDVQYSWIVGYLAPKRPAGPQKKKDETPPNKGEPKKQEKPPVRVGPPPLPPEPLAMGVPYYRTATGGYVPLAPPRTPGYTAPYPFPTAGGRYSWDYTGSFSNPWAAGYGSNYYPGYTYQPGYTGYGWSASPR